MPRVFLDKYSGRRENELLSQSRLPADPADSTVPDPALLWATRTAAPCPRSCRRSLDICLRSAITGHRRRLGILEIPSAAAGTGASRPTQHPPHPLQQPEATPRPPPPPGQRLVDCDVTGSGRSAPPAQSAGHGHCRHGGVAARTGAAHGSRALPDTAGDNGDTGWCL